MKEQNSSGKERLTAFFDADTFVELGAYIRRPESEDAEGVICGYGACDGRLVFAFSQDGSRMKGALDGRHADKIAVTYEKALAVGAPVVGFFDCAGAVVFEGASALAGYGKLLSTAAKAAGRIPQIAVIDGVCAGTMAAVAALFDLTVIVRPTGRLYVSSPAVIGEEVGTADYAAAHGNAALVAENTREAAALVADLLSYLPDRAGGNRPETATDDLNRALTLGARVPAKEALLASVDAGRFTELYPAFGAGVTAGLANMGGLSVIAAAIDGALTLAALKKLTRLLTFADRFGLPFVTFVNCEGLAASAADEPETAAAVAALASARVKAAVPQVTAIVGFAVGAGFLLGGAKTLGADVVFALPESEISTLSAETGVAFLWNDRITPEGTRAMLEEKWRRAAAPEAAAATGEVDDIVSPAELRARILAALMMLRGKRCPPPPPPFGRPFKR